MLTKSSLFLENYFYYLATKIDSKSIIASLIFLSPFTLGTFPILSYNYIYIYIIADILLFLLLFKRIISTGKILRYNFILPVIIFCMSFFFSVIFGLPYSDLTQYTNYKSDFLSVLIEISIVIPVLLSAMYFIYISVKSISEIYFYIKVILISAILVNFLSLCYFIKDYQGRLGGVFEDSNYLGRFEVIIISVLILFFIYSKDSFKKILYVSFIFISFFILIFTYSRSSFISLAIALFIIFSKSKRKFISFLFFAVVIVFISIVFLFIATQRVAGSSTGGDLTLMNLLVLDGSNFTRIILNISAFNMFLDFPISGIGFRNFYNVYINESYVPFGLTGLALNVSIVHSWFFSILGEQGLFGLLPILYIFYRILKYFKVLAKNLKSESHMLVHRALYIMFIILTVNGLFFPHFFFESFFTVLMGLIFGYFKAAEIESEPQYNAKY